MLLDLSSCDVLRPGVLCYVKGRVTSGSDASWYVTQRTWQCDGSPQVTWTCQIWLRRRTCQAAGYAVLRKEFLEVARGVR